MPSILFVCNYNQFRSPLAEAIFRDKLDKAQPGNDWIVASAGTWVTGVHPPVEQAISAAIKRGLSIQSHKSISVEALDLNNFDLILVMEIGQKEALRHEFPKLASRILLLSELDGGAPYSIPDPFVTGEPAEEIASEIETLILKYFQTITSLAARKD